MPRYEKRKNVEDAPNTKLVSDCPPEKTIHIYTRVSTQVQKDEGTSLESQYEEGVRRAKQLGFQWRHWDEGGLSSNHENLADRPKLNSLYHAIKSGQIKHIFVYDQSRLSRNDLVASVFRYECRRQGVTIHTKDGQYDLSNPSDNLLTQMMNAIAEFDNSTRSDRVRRGRLKRASLGYWMGGAPPYGYKVVDRRLTIEPEEAKWVRRIFENRAAGVSVVDIKRELDANYIRPRFRAKWSGASIRQIIRNTHSIGFYTVLDRLNGGEYRINCDQLISRDLWQQANDVIDKEWVRRRGKPRNRKAVLFRELIVCGHCGRNLVIYDTQTTKTTVYYCPMKQREWQRLGFAEHQGKRFTGCGMDRSIRVERFEAALLDLTRQVLSEKHRYQERFELSVSSGHTLINSVPLMLQLKRKLRELIGLRNSALLIAEHAEKSARLDNKEPDKYPTVAYSHRMRIKEFSEEIDAIKLRFDEREKFSKFVRWLAKMADSFGSFDSLSFEEKRQVVYEFIDGIEVRYRRDTKSHKLKVCFRSPFIGWRMIDIPHQSTRPARNFDENR